MDWLRSRKLKKGTKQWNDLYNCLHDFAMEYWVYIVLIDEKEWDIQKIETTKSAAVSDLRLAARIWPEGKSILEDMERWFDRQVKVREVEHINRNLSITERIYIKRVSGGDLGEWDDIQQQLKWAKSAMFACCDKIKKLTSIDVQSWLEHLNVDEDRMVMDKLKKETGNHTE